MSDFYAFTAIACVYVAVFGVIVYALDRWNASLDNDVSHLQNTESLAEGKRYDY